MKIIGIEPLRVQKGIDANGKPIGGRKMRIVELAQYVDANLEQYFLHPEDTNLKDRLTVALYWIVLSLTLKHHFFKHNEDAEYFALDMSAQYFHIFINKYRNNGQVKRNRVIEPVKSCLNYIKISLYPNKVQYMNKHYKIGANESYINRTADSSSAFERLVESEREDERVPEFEYTSDMLKSYLVELKQIMGNLMPYRNNVRMMHNIYCSVVLTFLNQLTLSKKKRRTDKTAIVLGHLPEHMADGIDLGAIKAKRLFTDYYRFRGAAAIDEETLDRVFDIKENSNGLTEKEV